MFEAIGLGLYHSEVLLLFLRKLTSCLKTQENSLKYCLVKSKDAIKFCWIFLPYLF